MTINVAGMITVPHTTGELLFGEYLLSQGIGEGYPGRIYAGRGVLDFEELIGERRSPIFSK